jgi:hypothetical protein
MSQPAGTVQGGVRALLRLEGLVVFACALWLFAGTGRAWWVFGALLLVPDVAMLAYLAGPRVGAIAYNAVHSYVGPLGLAVLSPGEGWGFALAAIWFAHCGMDRAAGYGLKYRTAFQHTHLGMIGRPAAS